MADIVISGDVSGAVTLTAPAVAGTTTLTLPTTSGTLVVTGGAQTVQFAAGSAAAPSITFTGDTNTGIFSPAADTIAFSEGGVESMRINSSGNVGINTANITSKFTLDTGASAGINIFRSDTNANFSAIVFRNSANNADQGLIGWSGNDLRFESVGASLFVTNSAERMRITSGGDVGIGTNSPTTKLTVFNGTSRTLIRAASDLNFSGPYLGTATSTNRGASLELIGHLDGVNSFSYRWLNAQDITGSADLVLSTAQGSTYAGLTYTERLRILTGGEFLLGATANVFAGNSTFSRFNANLQFQQGICISTTQTSGTGSMMLFGFNTAAVGNIQSTSSGTSFNTISDYRLKENIAPMTGALAKVQQLKPCTYTWKVDGSAGQGFIAHELQEVVPDCVTGEKDAVNEDGSIKPQGVDTSFLVATLTAAIQELNAKVEAQAAEIAALKGAN